jgi:hypothetical protein
MHDLIGHYTIVDCSGHQFGLDTFAFKRGKSDVGPFLHVDLPKMYLTIFLC